ncbi:ABC transporter permease [Bacillus niameyensis]|uniref:ABC transporter permease n=1 Tax=Bacillus niameyensis TaxID=1522308 RepID=UPI000784CC05|nr:ABC transporter permease subunit [Bacillus niameyensis]
MKNLLISEYERTFKRKKTMIGLLIFIFVLAFECFFLYAMGGMSFYNPEHAVQLNSINTAPFFLRELGIFMYFVLIPMFVVDSFNGEYSSGALRLILIRPQNRIKVLLAKWFVQISIFLGMMIFTWVVATVFGILCMPHVEETTFYQTGVMNPFTGALYTLGFYGIAFVIIIAVIGLCSLISMIMPNPILAYAGTVVTLVGSLYIHDVFDYFLTTDSIFKVLGESQSPFYVSLLFIILISSMMNIGIWKKKQWMG